MKEAAGEANMTVITIVLIGLVAAAGALIIPNLLSSLKDKSCCQSNGGHVDGSYCVITKSNGSTTQSTLKDYGKNCYGSSGS